MDPGKENYKQFARTYMIIRFATTGVMVVIHVATLAYVLGYEANMGMVAGGSVGLMFVTLGNVMGKIRPNWFVGIRTPWTLSSKLSWTKTHRVGGRLFIVLGIGIAATAFLKSEWAILGTAIASVVGSLALFVYSYFVWRNDADRVPPAGTSPAPEEPTVSK